ncbi:MAG: signal peptidase I [Candidatus Cybelea sp.]
MGIARFTLSAGRFAHRQLTLARSCLDGLIVAALAALFLITFVIRTFYIPSVSMVPTLQVRDVLLVDEIAYRLHRPGSGDVAVFTPPVAPGGNDYIKRVIGVPGDSIAISNGTVYRNGAALHEPYENQPPSYDLAIRRYGIYVNGRPLDSRAADVPPRALWQAQNRIPNGFYFVLGDNRNYSDDSHVWGFVRAGAFIGRAFMILLPLNRLHVLEK